MPLPGSTSHTAGAAQSAEVEQAPGWTVESAFEASADPSVVLAPPLDASPPSPIRAPEEPALPLLPPDELALPLLPPDELALPLLPPEELALPLLPPEELPLLPASPLPSPDSTPLSLPPEELPASLLLATSEAASTWLGPVDWPPHRKSDSPKITRQTPMVHLRRMA